MLFRSQKNRTSLVIAHRLSTIEKADEIVVVELVALSDHAAFSAPGLQRLTNIPEQVNALKKAQTLTNGHVYVTQGKKGCYWLEKGDICHQPGFTVEVVDTTGAGAEFGHPLSQCRNDNLATDDHRSRQREPQVAVFLHQQYQRNGDHQLVGHRIEKCPEWRALLQSSGQVPVQHGVAHR